MRHKRNEKKRKKKRVTDCIVDSEWANNSLAPIAEQKK